MKILITGSRGQLGRELINIAPKKHKIHGYDLDMDITNLSVIESEFKKIEPDIVIHCAAYTDVDGCEKFPRKAMLVNFEGTKNLAGMAAKYKAVFVYLSTDYVFNGKKTIPYIESDIPDPISIYGQSKALGEKAVAGIADNYYILRTTGLYSYYGKNFVDTIIKSSKKQAELEVVCDQVCTPTYSLDLAQCIFKLIETGDFGIYHTTNNGSCSWYEFTLKIFGILGLKTIIRPIKSIELTRMASRPLYSVLENLNLESRKIFFMRDWEEALRDFLKDY